MFDNEQDDFFYESDSDFSQQDINSSADFSNEDESFSQIGESPVQQNNSHVSLGYKTVGIVVAIILAVLALVILGLSNIRLVKKTDNTPKVHQEQTNNTQPQQTQPQKTQSTTVIEENETSSSSTTQSSSGTSLTDVPSSTYIDYSGKVISSQGVVQSLYRYLQDGQVIYCIDISITIGTTSTSVKYYCGYNVYKQVKIGDILTVDYQQVSDTCFSVCTISK